MKEQIQNLIKSAKLVAGVNAVAIMFSGAVNAKDLSTKECLEKFQGADFNTTDPEASGCKCEVIHALIDEKTGGINYRRMSCRAKTQKEKDDYCKEKFGFKMLTDDTSMSKQDEAGCTCETIYGIFDAESNKTHDILLDCHAKTLIKENIKSQGR